MILGIGTDVVEIARMRDAWLRQGDKMARRILSPAERASGGSYLQDRWIEYLAGRFAAKESIAKAIGCGLGRLQMQRVTLAVQEHGLTVVWESVPSRDVGEWAAPWPQAARWHVSISHSQQMAVAMAVLERED